MAGSAPNAGLELINTCSPAAHDGRYHGRLKLLMICRFSSFSISISALAHLTSDAGESWLRLNICVCTSATSAPEGETFTCQSSSWTCRSRGSDLEAILSKLAEYR